jgi:predicted nucleotidyltransferase component of viral defense system
MRADFVNEAARLLNIGRRDLVEKDFILHQILADLSEDGFFAPNFLFKGGTCLIKCYFGYLRFSEDIDFTWRDQGAFSKMSGKKIRSQLSKTIDRTGEVFEAIAKKRGLDFKCVKSNRDYVELGGNDKTCAFKIWYESETLKRRTFLKVQINFVETICFAPKRGELSGLLADRHEELETLFAKEAAEYAKKIPFDVYDISRAFLEEYLRLETVERIVLQYCKTAVLGYVCRQFAVKRSRCNGPAHEGYDSAWEIRFWSEHDPHRVQARVLYTDERVLNTKRVLNLRLRRVIPLHIT